ncbi:MAG: hypothetical protein GX020_04170 [Firmicutes bacterium]|nr:hypothetical protein [Bacillota bacterium]
MKTNRVIIIALVVLLVAGGAYYLFQGKNVDNSRVINIAIETDPDSFDPNQSVAAATVEIAFNIYEGLVKATADGNVVGALATHWEVDETETVYTFYLREAIFHNGQPLTVEDVVNALERVRDPQIAQGKADEYQVIESITPLDENTIQIKLSQPYGPFLFNLADFAASIYPKDATGLDANPIGTGPYKFEEWRANQYVKLVRFDDHWSGEQPHFEEVYFKIIPEMASAVISLKAGHVDLIPRLDPSFHHQVVDEEDLKVIPGPMNLVQIIALNNSRPPFNDPRVRQALALAIDKQEVITGAAWGLGDPLYSAISPAMATFFNEELAEVNAYDPERAKALLEEAGYSNLSFTFELPAPYPLHVNAGEIVAQQWAKIGVDVEIRIVEWGTWLERIYSQRDYDATIVGLAGRMDPHLILVRYQTNSSRNFFNFKNERYDELIAQGLVTSGEERIAIYHEAQEILAKEVAGVFVMDPNQLAVMQKDIQGWLNYPIYVVDVAKLSR